MSETAPRTINTEASPRFTRATWITPELDAFVLARNHLPWAAIYREWVETYPDRPAPACSEKMRAHYRRSVPKKIAHPFKLRRTGTLRPCMCCRDPFLSEGIHNRLCAPCKGRGW